MENTKVSGGKQTAANGQESKKSSGYKRNNNRKKNYYQQKKKKSNNSAKNDINKNFDELERKLEAKLESSLGLTPAAGGKKTTIEKTSKKNPKPKAETMPTPKIRQTPKTRKTAAKTTPSRRARLLLPYCRKAKKMSIIPLPAIKIP